MTKLNMDLLNRDLLYALNAQYLLMCNGYLRQSQASGYVSAGDQFTDLKGSSKADYDRKAMDANENGLSGDEQAKKKIDFSNLAQSILAEQARNGLLSHLQRANYELDKKSGNPLSLSSSSSSSFLQTDLSSSSFSSNSSQPMLLCSSPVQLTNASGSPPSGRQSNNPLSDQGNQLNTLNRNAANSSHLAGSQSSNLPQLTSNFNQLNLAQAQLNRSASLTASSYFSKQLQSSQFNLPNFGLDNKLIADKLITDKFISDKFMSDKFMHEKFLGDKFMSEKLISDKLIRDRKSVV